MSDLTQCAACSEQGKELLPSCLLWPAENQCSTAGPISSRGPASPPLLVSVGPWRLLLGPKTSWSQEKIGQEKIALHSSV